MMPPEAPPSAAATEPDAGIASLVTVLRSAGLRVTGQRRAILRALLEAGEHPDAESIMTAARRLDQTVHLSTVYRTLAVLDELGAVTHVHLGHGRAVYHLQGREHVHGVCSMCGTVVNIDPADLTWFGQAIRRRSGFVPAANQHFAMNGRCASCAAVVTDGPSPSRRGEMGS